MIPINKTDDDGVTARKLRVLHVVLSIGETNATYNEHCLPMAAARDIAVCTYFKSDMIVPSAINLFEGDGTISGFVRALRTALQANTFDVVHAHTPHVALLFVLATLPNREFSTPAIVTVHDSYPNYKMRNRLLFLPVFSTFTRVVCCSRSSYDSFPRLYRWLAGDRLDAVQNGVDIARVDRIAARCRVEREDKLFNIVAISRLVNIKNPFTVLHAFANGMEPRSRLTYIGDGPLRRKLLTHIKESGIDHQVTLTGLIPRDKVFENILSADLFISASLGEGLPISVLEAMACGCPVLLSDIPPHREIVGNVDFIPLIAPGDVSGFAREIARFRDMQPAERASIGQECRHLVEERFSLESMHCGYEAIYRSISQRSHRLPSIPVGVGHAG